MFHNRFAALSACCAVLCAGALAQTPEAAAARPAATCPHCAQGGLPEALKNARAPDRNGGRAHVAFAARKARAFLDSKEGRARKAKLCQACDAEFEAAAALARKAESGRAAFDKLCDAVDSAQNAAYDKAGIAPFANYYGTYLTNPSGGNAQGGAYTQMLQFGAGFDLEKIAHWKGATFTVSGMYNSGANLSDKIGNFFTASNTFVENGALMYEAYLNWQIDAGGDTVNLLLGRMSMGDVFASLPMFANIISGGCDSAPEAIFLNSPYQSMPIAVWGAVVQYTHEDLQLSVGAYQAPASLADAHPHGTDFGFHSDAGYMLMAQLQWSPTFRREFKDGKPVENTGLSGVYQLGAYYARNLPPALEISFGGGARDNVYGFYAQGQQAVWRDGANPARVLSLWGALQYAPLENVAIMPLMFCAGVQLQAVLPGRDADSLFLSWIYGGFSADYSSWRVSQGEAAASYEQVVELSYLIQVNGAVSLQPVLQYIMRPNGDAGADDALVVGAQVNVCF